MIATVIAFSIFMSNPSGTLGPTAGQDEAPYFFAGESQMREYPTKEACDADLARTRSQREDSLASVFSQSNAKYYSLKAKYDSLTCKQVTRQIETANADTIETESAEPEAPPVKAVELPPAVKPTVIAKDETPAESPYKTVYRIGRFEGETFHGTAYNATNYAAQSDCETAYHKTEVSVLRKAIRDGGDDAGAESLVLKFKAMYACQKIVIDPKEVEASDRQHAQAPAPTPVVAGPVLPQLDQPVPEAPQYPSVSGLSLAPPMSTRAYFMAEMMARPGVGTHWVTYAGAYASPAQCWEAVKSFVGQQQESIQRNYAAMTVNYGAAEWYRSQMLDLFKRRQRLTCVSQGSQQVVVQ
jgi:hypothetical protein